MARPLSEEKRQALLDAAADLVATQGVGASTAKIAQVAGVSEGTLFVYFPTKDDLLNKLFVEIESSLAGAMQAPYPQDEDARERFRLVWDRLVGWGVANPVLWKAIRQLKVSDRVTAESRRCGDTLFREVRAVVDQCLAGHADPARVSFYVETVLFDLAGMMIDAITAHPQDRDRISEAGFDLFWKGTAA
ncbi:MAG TPA: TetR/AcrR family transcriptional regulator [Luteolibacter sp.]